MLCATILSIPPAREQKPREDGRRRCPTPARRPSPQRGLNREGSRRNVIGRSLRSTIRSTGSASTASPGLTQPWAMIEYLPDSMAAGISKEYRKGGEVKALMGNEPTPTRTPSKFAPDPSTFTSTLSPGPKTVLSLGDVMRSFGCAIARPCNEPTPSIRTKVNSLNPSFV